MKAILLAGAMSLAFCASSAQAQMLNHAKAHPATTSSLLQSCRSITDMEAWLNRDNYTVTGGSWGQGEVKAYSECVQAVTSHSFYDLHAARACFGQFKSNPEYFSTCIDIIGDEHFSAYVRLDQCINNFSYKASGSHYAPILTPDFGSFKACVLSASDLRGRK